MIKYLLLVVVLCSCTTLTVSSQTFFSKPMIDSMSRLVATMPDDTAKVTMLNRIARAWIMLNLNHRMKTREYATEALKLSTKLGWKSGIAMSYNRIGNSYDSQSDSLSLFYTAKALDIWLELGDTLNISKGYSNLSVYHKDTAEARRTAFLSLKYAEASRDSNSIATAKLTVSKFYARSRINDMPQALSYGESSLSFYTASAEQKVIWHACNRLGYMYLKPYAYAKALRCFFKCLEVSTFIDDTNKIAMDIENIGIVYLYLKQYSKSLEYYEKSRAWYALQNNTSNSIRAMATMCEVYKMLPDDAKTLEFCRHTLVAIEKLHQKEALNEQVTVYRCIAEVYRRQKRYVEAVYYGKHALDLSRSLPEQGEKAYSQKELGLCLLALVVDSTATSSVQQQQLDSPEHRAVFDAFVPRTTTAKLRLAKEYLIESSAVAEVSILNEVMESCYRGLVDVAKLLGDYKTSTLYYEKYLNLKDATFSAENNNNISLLEMNQAEENTKKQQQIANLEIEKSATEKKIYLVGMLGLLLLSGLLYNRYRLKSRANTIITKEKARSEELLLNILPAEVAEELKAKGTADAKHFDNVTVLFTDFKSFTTVSEQLSPQELVNELHACFKGFDEICGKYNIEKIKTIGDAYLAVCGLPLADEKHAENVVNAALEIREFMANRSKELGAKTFEIRIGINSGSVVAGIVGVKKFAYDIWGDTVNTAARMEQSSEAGKINISETTYALVKDRFTCEYRGEIDAKNKGKLTMYFVEV